MTITISITVLPLIALLFLSQTSTSAFLSLHKHTASWSYRTTAKSSEDDWNSPEDEQLTNVVDEIGQEFAARSQIPDYIAAYLRKDSIAFQATHMVGIPMENNHELLIELESVQRAILFHCPQLVHACIVGTVTRMPLVYVDASYQPSGQVTTELQQITKAIVNKYYFAERSEANETDINGAGPEGFLPLTLNFRTLETDDDNHKVLYTKAVEGEVGTIKLMSMVQELSEALQAKGWMVQPCNNLRIPFMRLPNDFAKHFEPIPENEFRTPEQGGNGISPIFWFKWWDDFMGRSVRLHQVGIYPKRPEYEDNMDESAFYIPHETISLPNANEKLSDLEQHHAKYNEERMAKAATFVNQDDVRDTIMDQSLEENRQRLENMYEAGGVLTDGLVSIGDEPFVAQTKKDNDTNLNSSPTNSQKKVEPPLQHNVETTNIDEKDVSGTTVRDSAQPDSSPARQPLSDWMEDRIRKIVESRDSTVQRQQLGTQPENLPPITENPILNAFKAGTLVDKAVPIPSATTSVAAMDPSSVESCVGFWKIIESPTGIGEDMNDETQTDNLVLRVDGTTSGGPILNQEFSQRAAGGTWKCNENNDGSMSLRIRLVMPPKKERILVMEGFVTRGSSTALDITSASLLSASLFGNARETEEDESLQCRGEVWLEDAITKKNRKDIGTFFIKKLKTSKDPRDYTITIPKQIRNQD